jgi:type VI secretion system secreted protein VgrG
MPPFKLPDNKTQSGILTHSSKQGTSANYNMFRFEDKKGSEDVLLHAENTMHNSVESSQFITVGLNRNITTGGMDKEGNKVGDVKEKIFHNHNLHVLNASRVKIEGTQDVEVDDSSTSLYDKDRTVQVSTDEVLMANTITLQATETLTLVAGANSIVMGPSGITIVGLPMLNLNPMVAVPPIPQEPVVVFNPDDPDS